MSDVRGNAASNNEPPYAKHMHAVAEDYVSATVDLSWLESYDLDKIDALEAIIGRQALEVLRDRKDTRNLFKTKEDLYTYALGIAQPITTILSSFRKTHDKEESLFTMLFFVASLGYEMGVWGAHGGALSEENMRAIVKKREEADRKHRAMREFYDDIRGE